MDEQLLTSIEVMLQQLATREGNGEIVREQRELLDATIEASMSYPLTASSLLLARFLEIEGLLYDTFDC